MKNARARFSVISAHTLDVLKDGPRRRMKNTGLENGRSNSRAAKRQDPAKNLDAPTAGPIVFPAHWVRDSPIIL